MMMRNSNKRILELLATLFLLVSPVVVQAQQSIGNLNFTDVQGNSQTVAAYRGRPVLLHLWATWCAPCVQEIPALVRVQTAYQPYGLVLLPISQDFAAQSVIDFFQANGITNLPVLLDPESRMFASLGTRGLPISILIDRNGQEVRRFAGNTPWDSPQLRQLLNGLLAGR